MPTRHINPVASKGVACGWDAGSTVAPVWLIVTAFIVLGLAGRAGAEAGHASPNVVLIFTDDQGYADVGVYGAKDFATPHLDRLAAEGLRFTDFYAAPICSASRAALLTGCYPARVGIRSAIFPKDKHGLSPSEVTLAEVFKSRGYATAAIGKWHLGHMAPMLPTRQGFDSYYGIPYSNDMNGQVRFQGERVHNVPLMEDERVIEQPAVQATLTRRYTERAVAFLEDNRDQPFFLYLAHTMPHTPLAVTEEFDGRTARPYGDVIEELDWSVGQVMTALEELGLEDDTIVIFTSDNGPPTWKKQAIRGNAEPLRGGKQSTFEGGLRVPMIVRWPGRVPAGSTTDQLATTMDLLPTLAGFIGAEAPTDRVIDGKDIARLLLGEPDATSPHDYFYYLGWGDRMDAIRHGDWKLHVPYRSWKDENGVKLDKPMLTEMRLYNLADDIGETTNVADQHPDVVAKLEAQARAFEAELKRDARPAGYFLYGELDQ